MPDNPALKLLMAFAGKPEQQNQGRANVIYGNRVVVPNIETRLAIELSKGMGEGYRVTKMEP